MRLPLALLTFTAALACGDANVPAHPAATEEQDAGPLDAATDVDAGPPDAGPADSGPADSGVVADSGPLDAGPADSGPPPPDCDGLPEEQSDATWDVQHGGVTRRFIVHLPPGYDRGRAISLLLNFHGVGSNATEQLLLTAMNAKADAERFISVYPEGLPGLTLGQGWNAGTYCCSFADDVGFVNAMLDVLESRLCVNKRRVYATGFSNGGMFTHRLGCELAHRIAAIAPVSGVNLQSTCNPARPMPVLHTHGSEDTTVPYNGGYGGQFPSAASVMQSWANRAGCDPTPVETFRLSNTHCDTWPGCADDVIVRFCTVDGLKHFWPQGIGDPLPASINGTDTVWAFLKQFALP